MHVNQKLKLPTLTPQPIGVRIPDFSGGLCTSVHGGKVARAAMTQEASMRAIRIREQAKALCNIAPCPIRAMCRAWVLGQENPPGSWGGVYGGLDSWNRRGLRLIIRNGRSEAVPYDIDER